MYTDKLNSFLLRLIVFTRGSWMCRLALPGELCDAFDLLDLWLLQLLADVTGTAGPPEDYLLQEDRGVPHPQHFLAVQ